MCKNKELEHFVESRETKTAPNTSYAIIILNASALPLAEKIKASLDRDCDIYALAGKINNFPREFARFSDFVQTLYQQNRPIIAVCASGIVIRSLAPILGKAALEPPVLSVAIDASSIVPLLGVTSGANMLARALAQKLNAHAAITTSGELRFGLNLLTPPADLELINRENGKKFISQLLDGAAVRFTGVMHDWLLNSKLPVDAAATLQIHIALENEVITMSANRLIYRLHTDAVTSKPSSRGRVTIVGLGPGAIAQRSHAVHLALNLADDVLGYGFYVDQAGPFHSNQRLHYSDNRQELARAIEALNLAGQGRRAVLVSSGDAGVFGMAAAFFEILEQAGHDNLDIDIVVEPGITAALAASSRFGAPLGGDFAVISLSDNLKSQSVIEQRLRLAAQADMAMALYNPVSKARPHQIGRVLAILREEKPPTTPIGLATDIGRPAEQTLLTTLQEIRLDSITSRTIVLVGSSRSRIFHACGRTWFYTPRTIV